MTGVTVCISVAIEICVKILYMQTISINNGHAAQLIHGYSISFSRWFQKITDSAERSRFGVVGALILLQVSIAGFNVVIPPMTGASVYLMAPGIFAAFLSNSLALAQAKMKYILLGFAASMVINAAISIYCFMQL